MNIPSQSAHPLHNNSYRWTLSRNRCKYHRFDRKQKTASDSMQGVQTKRRKKNSAEKSSWGQPEQPPRVPRDQCLIIHGLPKTRADTGSLETRHNIDELSKVIKPIVPPSAVVIILKTHCLVPQVANLPNSPRPQKVVLSEAIMRWSINEMYMENAVREVRQKNLLPIHRSNIQGSRGTSA